MIRFFGQIDVFIRKNSFVLILNLICTVYIDYSREHWVLGELRSKIAFLKMHLKL